MDRSNFVKRMLAKNCGMTGKSEGCNSGPKQRTCTFGSSGTPKSKVKESHNTPGVAQRVPGGLGSQISMILG